ncbi:hypothetical protein V2S66_31525 [Streptomyces sp. V4-01]|uniref:Uncharacterized protein n=1 Tax=Actinacidiphila polyblastidii TaxID=3110430 RepID=A0ABU7PKW4_9ACTN|nr:hypothetical protein [Streptomyces sp. V4-01]
MFETPITPPLHGVQPPSATPTCGSLLQSMDGIPCGEPATWHIRWDYGGDRDEGFDVGLACQPHMDQIAAAYSWYDRHTATPACSAAKATWEPGRCAEVS